MVSRRTVITGAAVAAGATVLGRVAANKEKKDPTPAKKTEKPKKK
jgi:hypothetical protein